MARTRGVAAGTPAAPRPSVPYRDVDALLTQVARFEDQSLRVRARARRLAHRRARRLLRRTLVGLVAAVAVAGPTILLTRPVCGCVASTHQARNDAQTLKLVAEKWRGDHGPSWCPTLEGLVHDHEISRHSRLDDPWGHRYELRCEGDDTRAASAGPDGRFGTPDDIVEPDPTR